MPAVTADTTTLPKLPDPQRHRARPSGGLGDDGAAGLRGRGLPRPPGVRRRRPSRRLDPFIHMDQMGEVDYAPYEPKGTDWHPHRGFETVTYIIDGTFQHQDSHGGGGADHQRRDAVDDRRLGHPAHRDAARGARRQRRAVPRHPAVGQPAGADKMTAPRYQNLEADQSALLSSPDGGALVRLIAGDVAGHVGPGSTHTPITWPTPPWRRAPGWSCRGARTSTPSPTSWPGPGTVGAERRPVDAGQLTVFGDGRHDRRSTALATTPLEVLLLGGRPIREPVAAYGPFVMNTRAELVQAVEDFNAGRLGTIPADGLRRTVADAGPPALRPARALSRRVSGREVVLQRLADGGHPHLVGQLVAVDADRPLDRGRPPWLSRVRATVDVRQLDAPAPRRRRRRCPPRPR